jgi:ferredoxin-NADP reductase
MSIVRHLLAKRYAGDLVCLHYARHESIFGAEMAELAQRHSQLQVVTVRTGDGSAAEPPLRGHFSLEQLETVAPFWTECEAFVCGPAALSAAVSQLFHVRGLAHRLHEERFVSAVPIPVDQPGVRRRITFARSGRTIDGNASASLLDQAEGAGLRPAYGCRMGICHSCKCKKLSGAVRNVLTGAVSHGDEEEIQLCVNTPHSDITLEL